ncbi:MAG: TerB family tellurite resistance protein [Bacteroidota bacterium]|nr:TerB family tellurite resistance protein [Bacteroidota bacterium]
MGKKYGRWIGGGLGWVLGGPIGGLLGFAFGSMFDGMESGEFEQHQNGSGGFSSRRASHPYEAGARSQTREGDFSVSLLVLSAVVMKADGKVLKSELEYVKKFLSHQFGENKTNQLMPVLKDVLKKEINIMDVSLQIKQFMDYSARLQLLHFLFGISQADGHVHENEISLIELISGYLGVGGKDFTSIKAMFVKDNSADYDILEISADATDQEVKAAYRKMATKYHPDMVSHLGEDIVKSAEKKFQKLNTAYQNIKKERGIK